MFQMIVVDFVSASGYCFSVLTESSLLCFPDYAIAMFRKMNDIVSIGTVVSSFLTSATHALF